jgi:D-serine deaminase-like pyridoxal phosphate-dependent protein
MGTLADTARTLETTVAKAPALVVDEARARANLAVMAARAAASGVVLRPHFKTHASVGVGRWFRQAGVRQATVSSMAMAEQFAADGWDDLTLAVLADPAELPGLAALSQSLLARGGNLGVVVADPDVAALVRAALGPDAKLWLKVDTGYGRSGIIWSDAGRLRAVAATATPAGLLAHAGHAYRTPREALPELFAETAERLAAARDAIGAPLLLSVGDTPTCTSVDRFDGVDEVRPGNFLFFDFMQLAAGVCGPGQLALAVACPVLEVDRARGRLVLRGGAVHLGKEAVATPQGTAWGCLATAHPGAFADVLDDVVVQSLSQEHAVVTVPPGRWDELVGGLRPGDRALVVPAHSCLTCQQFAGMVTIGGVTVLRYASEAT